MGKIIARNMSSWLRIIITACYVRLRKKGKGWVKEKVKDGQSLHPDTLKLEKEYYKLCEVKENSKC